MNEIEKKYQQQLSDRFETKLDELLDAHKQMHFALGGASTQTGGAVKEYQTVSPAAKHKLKGILRHYAKMPHPFTACVKDQVKHGLPLQQAQKRCAVIKDIIRGTTKWRGKNNPNDHGTPGVAGLAEPVPVVDQEVALIIDHLGELDLYDLMGLAALDNE